ncbi:MAG: YcjX family protein [Proteobacteria bacterium]|nr:YcjX family protein [Pseudomonadota bacterium]
MTDLQRWTDLALAPLKAAGDALVDFPALLTHERRRVAITGLQRSGKTVFITAFAHALVTAQSLPFFPFIKKVRDVSLHDVPGLPRFDVEGHLAGLRADPPRWPAATHALSAVRVRIQHDPESFLGRLLASTATLDVDLVDYPGEWLIDLPLLTRSYDEWSRQSEDLAAAPARRDLAAAWRADAALIDLDAPANPALLARVGRLYVDYLRSCRGERALSYLQPGRFLQPETTRDEILFFPVARLDRPKRGSNGAVLVERYEAYRGLVRQFHAQVFGRLRRQVVLIDLLTALQQGPDAFADLALTVRTIAEAFDALSPAFAKLLPFAGIDRLALVATKADEVASTQLNNLVGLLESMTGALMLRDGAASSGYHAIASVRATSEVWHTVNTLRLPFLVGIEEGESEPKEFFMGAIPGTIPAADDWSNFDFRIRRFAPPRGLGSGPLPHLNMDKLLQFLLG